MPSGSASREDVLFTQNTIAPIRPYAVLRLTFLIIAHLTIASKHSRKTVPLYGRRIVLIPHIASGLVETYRFAIQDLWSDPPPSGPVDVLLCLVQSGTNAFLAWNLQRGVPVYTRPSYLSGAILRPVLTLSSYYLSKPRTHIISVYLLDGFIHTRLIIYLLRRTGLSPGQRYALAVPGAAIIGAGTAGWRCGGVVLGSRTGRALVAVMAYLAVTGSLIVVRGLWKWRLVDGKSGELERREDRLVNLRGEAVSRGMALSRSESGSSTSGESGILETPQSGLYTSHRGVMPTGELYDLDRRKVWGSESRVLYH